MSNKYNLIALDMDGTLLNTEKMVTDEVREAIAAAGKAGKYVVLSTGRCDDEIRFYFDMMPEISHAISSSGGHVFNSRSGETIYSNPLPREAARAVISTCKDRDVFIQYMSDRNFIPRRCYEHLERYYMEGFYELYSNVATMSEDMFGLLDTMSNPIYKINLHHRTFEDQALTRKRIDALPYEFEVVDSEVTSLEISRRGIGKGKGLIKLCEHLGIAPEECIAVGDADNDLSILKVAGLPVAMGNANENVKSVAGAIVANNDHNGVAEAIYKYLI